MTGPVHAGARIDPLVVIETLDEQRVIENFRHVIGQVVRPLWRWASGRYLPLASRLSAPTSAKRCLTHNAFL